MSPGRADDSAGGLIEGILQRAPEASPASDDESVLLTFLFADIRGYTRFTQERGDEAAAKLTAKFAMIVRDLVGGFGGTVFEQRGDEALCVFVSPRQSLRLAVALQQRFVEETAADPELPMTVGIGVDAGEAVRGPDGYRGGALNLAARLCARAKAGEVLASPEVTHLARAVDGVRYVVLDRVSLKGLDEPVRPMRVLPATEDPVQQLAALLAAATAPARPATAVAWLPGPLARRPRATLAGAALLAAAVATTVVVVVKSDDTAPALAALDENSLGILDPDNGRIVGEVAVGAGPIAAAAGFGSVWTANADDNSVTRVDTKTHALRTIGVGASPSAIAVGPDSVWVANGNSGTVSRIDPGTNTPQTIPAGSAPAGVVVAHGSVWVTNSRDGTVSRIDPSLNRVVESIDVGDTPRGIGAGRDIWVANSASNTVSRINGSGKIHTVSAPIDVGRGPLGVAVAGDGVWVTNALDGTVTRIPTSGTSVAGTVGVGDLPGQPAVADDHIWITRQATDKLVELDSDLRGIARTVPLGPDAGGLVASAGKLWVTTTTNPVLHRGGTLHVLDTDPGSVDPTHVETPEQSHALTGSYDALVGNRHAGGIDGTALVPDLATALPEPTDAGRTYTFQLRTGVRWSDGRPLTVFDVQRGIARGIAYRNTGLAPQIVGGDSCGPSRSEVRGVTVDPATRTVRINLVRPDGSFLGNLANVPAVPADTPLAKHKRRIVAATGPYRIARYTPGKRVVLVRNRFFHEWSPAAQPDGFPDRIDWEIIAEGVKNKILPAVASGHSDWADARDEDKLDAMQARFGNRVHLMPNLTTHGLFLNTRIRPFNDVRVRRALALAVDRQAIADAWNESVTCQFLPPNFPGYRPYCPYTLRADDTGRWTAPDLEKARRLVRGLDKSGVITIPSARNGAAGLRHVVAALHALGYRARLSIYRGSVYKYFEYVADSRNRIQAGFYGWVIGNGGVGPYFSLWGCDAFVPNDGVNNLNPAGFCDPTIDRLAQQAGQLQASSPAPANRLGTQIDRLMVRAVPWIPLTNDTATDVVSRRVHNYQRSPFLGVLFDQMWVR